MQAERLCDPKCILGEGPLWHPQRNSCFWVDIEGRVLYEYRWANGEMHSWNFEHRVSAIFRSEGQGLILAMQGGLAKFDCTEGSFIWLMDLDAHLPGNRCNDGECDSEGRIWIGTMDRKCQKGAGSLFCVYPGGHARKKLSGVSISNGIAWSPENTRMYYTDSSTRQIVSFIFDAATGNIVFDRIAVTIPEELGMPDGMAMDREGMLWIAHWGGFGVYRWDPASGKVLARIGVPAPLVTSCAFYGEDFDRLIITTAREGLSDAELALYPDSGNIFIARPGVKGRPIFSCDPNLFIP